MQHAVDVHEIKSIFKQQQEWKIVPHTQAQILLNFFCCCSIPTIVSHTHIVTLCYVYFHYAGMAFLQLNKEKKCIFFIPTVSLLLSLRHSTSENRLARRGSCCGSRGGFVSTKGPHDWHFQSHCGICNLIENKNKKIPLCDYDQSWKANIP